jgi:hypothetical protein
MKKVIYIIPVIATLLCGCNGVDSDLLASGKNHQCNIDRVTELLNEDPDNKELQKELEEYKGYYETIIDSAKDGAKSNLEAAIQEAAKTGCD